RGSETTTLAGEGITSVVLARLPRLRPVSDFPRSPEAADLAGLARERDSDCRSARRKTMLMTAVSLLAALAVRGSQLPQEAVKALRRRSSTSWNGGRRSASRVGDWSFPMVSRKRRDFDFHRSWASLKTQSESD